MTCCQAASCVVESACQMQIRENVETMAVCMIPPGGPSAAVCLSTCTLVYRPVVCGSNARRSAQLGLEIGEHELQSW